MKKYNIVVVGGGVSGLYLANLFQKKLGTAANNVAIFEKSYRVGGRVKSQSIEYEDEDGPTNITIEEGAGRIMANHRRLRGLIQKYGLEKDMMWKLPPHDTKLSKLIAKVRKYAATRHDICKQLTYLELMHLCLTPVEIEYYLANYGFGDEIHYLQAGHAVRQFGGDLCYDRKFFVIRGGGLEAIIRGLEEDANNRKISIHMQHLLKKVTYLGSSNSYPYRLEFEVFNTFRKVVIYAREIVLCIPPNSLKHITFNLEKEEMHKEQIRKSIERVTNMVQEGTLIRIYAKYRDAWFRKMRNNAVTAPNGIAVTSPNRAFKGDGIAVTGGILRNIIPISNNENTNAPAIIQYYSDYNQAKELEQYRLAGAGNDKLIKEVIQRELKCEFGAANAPTSDPEWLKMFYWNAGVHHWKPNVDIDREISNIQWDTFGDTNQHKIGIVGEAFCRNQGWIEGALENAEEYYKEWVKRRKMKMQRRLRRRVHLSGGYTQEEVAKHNTRGDAWTIIHNRVYDITKFIDKHPGGAIILNAAGQDGTKYFEYIQHPEYVRNIMEKYYKGWVV